MHFVDRLYQSVQARAVPLCVGLDPHVHLLPQYLIHKHLQNSDDIWSGYASAIEYFLLKILDRISPLVPAVKPQWAFFEQLGAPGIAVLQNLVKASRERGLLVISDAKRGDIGSTAEAYANVFFGNENLSLPAAVPSDAVTVNPYLGYDAIAPFVNKNSDNGVFVLVKTSNASGAEFQDLLTGDMTLAEKVAEQVNKWGMKHTGACGWSNIGAVVGANHPLQAEQLRKIMPCTPFLIPGFGAQGGKAEDAVVALKSNGEGGIINSSRDILFAFRKEHYMTAYGEDEFDRAAEEACKFAVGAIQKALAAKS
jgi:orotidine-5'-phosphate decarboxylase